MSDAELSFGRCFKCGTDSMFLDLDDDYDPNKGGYMSCTACGNRVWVRLDVPTFFGRELTREVSEHDGVELWRLDVGGVEVHVSPGEGFFVATFGGYCEGLGLSAAEAVIALEGDVRRSYERLRAVVEGDKTYKPNDPDTLRKAMS